MTDVLGMVDICVVIDTTASMTPYIREAAAHALQQAKQVSDQASLDIRYAVVEYRDHVPQDMMLVAKYPFGSAGEFQGALSRLYASGGGDEAEAVWDGVKAGADLEWRENADHLMFLIGDSPPHGVGCKDDGFPDGCPCGLTGAGLSEVLSMRRIRLYAHSIAGNEITTREFTRLAEASGGSCTEVARPEASTFAYTSTLHTTGELIESSRTYNAAWAATVTASPGMSVDEIFNKVRANLDWTPEYARGVANYISSRGIPTGGSINPTININPPNTTDKA